MLEFEKFNGAIDDLRLAVKTLTARNESHHQSIVQIHESTAIPIQTCLFERISSSQLSYFETLRLLGEDRYSLSRFGDGELSIAAHSTRSIGFQRGSYHLTNQLREILRTSQEGLLVGMPVVSLNDFWLMAMSRYWGVLQDLIPQGKTWGNSMVSRSDAFFLEGRPLVDAWRKIWDDRNVTIVTGLDSRFHLEEELFSNCRSVNFVFGPSRDAFENIEPLLASILEKSPDLVLVSLGPAGTILSRDLHLNGVQAVDIGHLPNSFREAFYNEPKPELLPFRNLPKN